MSSDETATPFPPATAAILPSRRFSIRLVIVLNAALFAGSSGTRKRINASVIFPVSSDEIIPSIQGLSSTFVSAALFARASLPEANTSKACDLTVSSEFFVMRASIDIVAVSASPLREMRSAFSALAAGVISAAITAGISVWVVIVARSAVSNSLSAFEAVGSKRLISIRRLRSSLESSACLLFPLPLPTVGSNGSAAPGLGSSILTFGSLSSGISPEFLFTNAK